MQEANHSIAFSRKSSSNQPGDIEPMMHSLYVTLGNFLLLVSRQPSVNRNLIAFTAWATFAHATVMAVQALQTQAPADNCWPPHLRL